MVSGEMAEAARKKQQRESRAKRSRANGPVCASLSRVPCRPLEARSVPRAMRRGCDTCGPRQSCTNACAMVRARACGHQRHHRDGMGTREMGALHLSAGVEKFYFVADGGVGRTPKGSRQGTTVTPKRLCKCNCFEA